MLSIPLETYQLQSQVDYFAYFCIFLEIIIE